ncbi:MAG: pyridoxamine 5'-phosphate oxidase family protein [Pelagimonas sp.]|uniref:pyridoxamine 5'-phosphate oxidase family protein n=1 Tax=Pelagimonas sp. TaxID=2073170 RepID=UPI003D6C6F21
MRKVTSLKALSDLYDEPMELALRKVAGRITPLYKAWIVGARFCVLSTVGPQGVHGSPRGDDGPVVRVVDEQTIHMPDWRGNNRIDALRDIVSDGRVALLFLVPGSNTTVRVNGRAFLTDDAALRAGFARGKIQPSTVIVIEVEEVFTQCAKALMRSGLWARDDSAEVPTVGEILEDMTEGDISAKPYDQGYDEHAKPRMW